MRAPWQNPKIVFTLLAIFLCGAAAGAITMRKFMSPERHSGLYWNPASREASLESLTRELELTPEQQKEMATVLDDFMMYYQTLQAQMDDVRSTGKNRVMKILNEDQKQRFNKILSKLQTRPAIR
jgi:hypothetical protein